MAGRLLTALEFVSDADFAIDFLVLDENGFPQDLTGFGAKFDCALWRSSAGFGATVGAGILFPGQDGRLRVRFLASQMAARAGFYDPCELRLLPPTGETIAKASLAIRIGTGASQIIGGASRAFASPLGMGPYTVTIPARGEPTAMEGIPATPVGRLDFSNPDNSGLIGH